LAAAETDLSTSVRREGRWVPPTLFLARQFRPPDRGRSTRLPLTVLPLRIGGSAHARSPHPLQDGGAKMNLPAPTILPAATTQHVLHRDYESRGVLKLEDVGAWKYAADPRTEILCCAYAVDNDPVKLWLPPDPPPPEFFEAAQNSDWETAAHNAQFEIALEHFILCRRYGFPKFPFSRQRCTMAMALACSLPPKLELAADALELVHRKDKAGQRLMLMLAKPRRPRKDEDPQALLWFDDEERRQRLYDYA